MTLLYGKFVLAGLDGCIDSDLHQDNENPVDTLFCENWNPVIRGRPTWAISTYRIA